MDSGIVYTLTYDANGGENAPASVTASGNSSYAIFDATDETPSRDGFVFSGWSFSPNGTVTVRGGDYFTVTSQNVTLFAIWTEATSESEVIESAIAEDGEAEPLGVFTSSELDRQTQIVGDAIGFAFIGAAIVLGLIAMLLFRQKQPRIISKEEVKEK